MDISIHAAREGGDYILCYKYHNVPISIHAAREGGDAVRNGCCTCGRNFNPRRP